MNNLINLSILYVIFSISYVIPNENMQKNVNYLSSEPINKNNYIQLDIEKYYTINKILPPSFGFILTHDDMLQSIVQLPLTNSQKELIDILFKNFQINDHTKTSGIL